MKFEDLEAIIAFAIDKEQEAIDFYTDLENKVKAVEVAEELLKMAEMERGHKKKLEDIDISKLAATPITEVKDLKLADYTVDAVITPEMNWADVINVAMHREFAAAKLYEDLAGMVSDTTTKQVLTNLMHEEKKHKLFLESVWDQEVLKEN